VRRAARGAQVTVRQVPGGNGGGIHIQPQRDRETAGIHMITERGNITIFNPTIKDKNKYYLQGGGVVKGPSLLSSFFPPGERQIFLTN